MLGRYKLFQKLANKIWLFMLLGLIVYNASFFSLKNLQVISSTEERSPQSALTFIKDNIPEGSKVVGGPMFFYAVTQAGSEYQYYNLYETLEDRERIHREEWDYDYLLVTKKSYAMRTVHADYYLSKANFAVVDSLSFSPSAFTNEVTKPFGVGLLSPLENEGYSCILYRRIK